MAVEPRRSGGTRDTRKAVWASRVPKWRKWAAELSALPGVIVVLPDDFDTVPHLRGTEEPA